MHTTFRNTARGGRPFALAALGLAIAGSLAAPPQAHASAFQLKENSAKAMGRAYAGSATAGGDVSVVANNPAAMSARSAAATAAMPAPRCLCRRWRCRPRSATASI
jgi:long-chain fatty acid transport protein